MDTGKRIRLGRLLHPVSGRCIIIPMDHGITDGPIAGLENPALAVADAVAGGADAVLMHKGLVPYACAGFAPCPGLIVHLSAGSALSPSPNSKVLVAEVEEAVSLGADGVSVHVNMGDAAEGNMLADLGRTAREARRYGMPLLAMVYARGPGIADSFAPGMIAHCARAAAELGADLVKVSYTGDPDSFRRVVECCPVPVLIAGGARLNSTAAFLELVRDCLSAGAAGLSAGRNIFQHPRPQRLVAALAGIVHQDMPLDQALALAEGA